MNVLFLSNEFPTSAHPLHAGFNRQMIQGLAPRHRVHVVCPVPWTTAPGRRVRRARAARHDAFSARYPRFYFPPRVALSHRGSWMWHSLKRGLLRDAAAVAPDIILSYWAHPDGEVALRLARRIGVPAVLMVGGSDVLVLTANARRRARIVAVLRGVDAVLTVGEHLRDRAIALGAPAERVASVMRPVDPELFHARDRCEARRRLGLPSDHVVLLAVARLVPGKAIDVLLRALPQVRTAHPKTMLCIAGEGPEAKTLSALSQRLGVAGVVRWLGGVPHEALPDWYCAADVAVLPSLSEGVPNVLLEAIACGTPFVASRVGSIPALADESCDRLVPPGDVAALAAGIGHVLARRPHATGRPRRLVEESAFQAQLDETFDRCVAAAGRAPGVAPARRLATHTDPSLWRQAARYLLVRASPRRWLVSAGEMASLSACLTFDDGPHEVVTPGVLDLLRREGVRATFFVRGDRASLRPDLVQRIVAEGHLLGHHSWSHGVPRETSARRLLDEARRTRDWLRREIGVDSPWFRPPHGKLTLSKLVGLWAAGLTIALWNLDPGDVRRSDAQEMLDWFTAHPIRGGDVILLHDTSMVTLEALPPLIASTRRAGIEFTTLDRFGGPTERSR